MRSGLVTIMGPGASKLARARPSTVAHRGLDAREHAQPRFWWVPGGRGEFSRLGESETALGEAGRGEPADSGILTIFENCQRTSTGYRILVRRQRAEGRSTAFFGVSKGGMMVTK